MLSSFYALDNRYDQNHPRTDERLVRGPTHRVRDQCSWNTFEGPRVLLRGLLTRQRENIHVIPWHRRGMSRAKRTEQASGVEITYNHVEHNSKGQVRSKGICGLLKHTDRGVCGGDNARIGRLYGRWGAGVRKTCCKQEISAETWSGRR